MNKSAAERLTECEIRRIEGFTWGLFSPGAETPLFTETGRKEKEVFESLERQFWKMRRKEVLDRDGHKCVECKSPFGLSVDHIKNRSQGGTHSMSNTQTLCRDCHYSKTNLLGKWAKERTAKL